MLVCKSFIVQINALNRTIICRVRPTYHISGVHIRVHLLHHVGHHLGIALDGCIMEGSLAQLYKQVECYLNRGL